MARDRTSSSELGSQFPEVEDDAPVPSSSRPRSRRCRAGSAGPARRSAQPSAAGLTTSLLLGVRWLTAAIALLVLVLTGVADAVLRAGPPQGPGAAPLRLRALPRHGLLLAEVRFREAAAVLLGALGWARSVATMAGPFWLIYRVSSVIEAGPPASAHPG